MENDKNPSGDYPMKLVSGNVQDYNQMNALIQIELQNKEKYEKFKKRVEAFKGLQTISEARELAAKLLPVSKEVNIFRVGTAKCTVVNRKDLFRICIDTPDEFISYNFE